MQIVAISLLIEMRMNKSDFVETASGTFLNDEGRRAFWESWFRRMDTEIKHPEFGYKMSYRRMLEVQVRQLWRVFRGSENISCFHNKIMARTRYIVSYDISDPKGLEK